MPSLKKVTPLASRPSSSAARARPSDNLICQVDMVLTGDGVRVDYQNYEGKPVSVHFQFGPTGKIIHTTCGPRVRTERIDAAA